MTNARSKTPRSSSGKSAASKEIHVLKQRLTDYGGQIEAIRNSQPVIEFNMDGTIITANEIFLSTVGYTLEEIQGGHHSMFLEPQYKASAEYKKLWEKLGQGKFQECVNKHLAKDGEEIWMQGKYYPVLDGNGEPFKVVRFTENVTKNKLQDANYIGQIQAIHKSQAVIEFNMDGTIITANENFLGTVGYTLEEIKGQHHSMFVEPDYKASAEYSQFWDNLNQGAHHVGEYKRIGKGGKEVWIQATYNPIMDLNGKPFKVVKYATEVTARKLRGADMRGQIEAIGKSQAVIEFNMDGTIITANENFLNTVGYTLEEIKGQHHSMFVEPDYKASAEYSQFWDKLNQGTHHAGEYKRIGKGGKEVWIQATYNPIMDLNGKPFKVVKFASDISEIIQEKLMAGSNARIKQALDKVNANVMVADANLDIIYLNETAGEMFAEAQADIRTDLPKFDASSLVGTNIDIFHKNPAHQRRMLAELSDTFSTNIAVGGRTFQIIANPVNDEDGERLGTVVEWEDLTAQLAREEEERQRAEQERAQATANGRIKQALDNVSANVMVADAELNIIYLNDTVREMFRTAESDIRKDLPSFDTNELLGTNIDEFHKNPAHQRGMLARLSSTLKSELKIGGRTFKIVANPIIGDTGERIGTVVEWADRTAELAVEDEVQAIVGSAMAGDLSQRIPLEDKTGFFESLSSAINDLVDVSERVINDNLRVLGAMARGDLSETIEADYEGAFGQLKHDANATIEKLTEVIAQIKSGADEINTGAEEISQGNNNLSQRTEEQASSLEETASSMEQMTGTVKQNADNAAQANQLASGARQQAEQGGQVVSQAVAAMAEINSSSKKIADIIGVIDEIAFQTNLLALNAAVEAARAGEQGRGFAVVASEVRNLAQRSATAAKEIKDLIQDSVGKVEDGSKLVDQSGETLEEIVNSVKKVSDIVAEIAAASQEQSSGIEQVNKAIVQMDEMTQQNAALVEQAAAASESMSEQARNMDRQMDFFNIGGEYESRDSLDAPIQERRSPNRAWASKNTAPVKPSAKAARVEPRKVVAGGGNDEWEKF